MAIIERLRVLERLGGDVGAARQHRGLQARHRHVVIFDELLVARAEVTDEIALREGDGVLLAARVRCAAPIGRSAVTGRRNASRVKTCIFNEQRAICIEQAKEYVHKKGSSP